MKNFFLAKAAHATSAPKYWKSFKGSPCVCEKQAVEETCGKLMKKDSQVVVRYNQ